MRATRWTATVAVLACLAAWANPLTAQGDKKAYWPRPLKVQVPATQGEIDRLWDFHNSTSRLPGKGINLPLWDVYTALANEVGE